MLSRLRQTVEPVTVWLVLEYTVLPFFIMATISIGQAAVQLQTQQSRQAWVGVSPLDLEICLALVAYSLGAVVSLLSSDRFMLKALRFYDRPGGDLSEEVRSPILEMVQIQKLSLLLLLFFGIAVWLVVVLLSNRGSYFYDNVARIATATHFLFSGLAYVYLKRPASEQA